MLDGLFEIVSGTLNFFYTLIPNYAIAIALLTCVVMIITTPLTLKGTRSMIEMQRLQPEIRRLQVQYKDDRQKLNEELMAFYKEHEINPVGGCLPLLIQAPVFSILFYVVQGLTRQAKFVGVQQMLVDGDYQQFVTNPLHTTRASGPKYLNSSDELYQSLLGQDHMNAFGVDLSQSAVQALGEGFLHALPYIVLVAFIAVLSWYQQKQIMGRNAGAEVTQQQQMMMRIGPLMYVFFAFVSPAAIGIYFLVSTLWRVGQQYYITRSLYGGEDSVGRQAQQAMAEIREAKKQDGAQGRRGQGPGAGEEGRRHRPQGRFEAGGQGERQRVVGPSEGRHADRQGDRERRGPGGQTPPPLAQEEEEEVDRGMGRDLCPHDRGSHRDGPRSAGRRRAGRRDRGRAGCRRRASSDDCGPRHRYAHASARRRPVRRSTVVTGAGATGADGTATVAVPAGGKGGRWPRAGRPPAPAGPDDRGGRARRGDGEGGTATSAKDDDAPGPPTVPRRSERHRCRRHGRRQQEKAARSRRLRRQREQR